MVGTVDMHTHVFCSCNCPRISIMCLYVSTLAQRFCSLCAWHAFERATMMVSPEKGCDLDAFALYGQFSEDASSVNHLTFPMPAESVLPILHDTSERFMWAHRIWQRLSPSRKDRLCRVLRRMVARTYVLHRHWRLPVRPLCHHCCSEHLPGKPNSACPVYQCHRDATQSTEGVADNEERPSVHTWGDPRAPSHSSVGVHQEKHPRCQRLHTLQAVCLPTHC